MKIHLNLNSLDDYKLFLRIKSLPRYSFAGRVADVPDEYAALLGMDAEQKVDRDYRPSSFLFDYQAGVSRIAIRKKKFAVFMDMGLGKTLILAEYVRHAAKCLPAGRCALIVSPLMVVEQTMGEIQKFYGDKYRVEQIPAARLQSWLASGKSRIGITNFEAIRPSLTPGRLGCLAIDESGTMKSHYGKWGTKLIELGKGLEWKLCLTGTPAPNDRIEYANHAVFLDAFPNVNSFLAKYFVNRGQTGERWEIKPHALRAFYTALSHWCIFVTNPATYGWKDNTTTIPSIHVHIHEVGLTDGQRDAVVSETGSLFAASLGGITSRSTLGQISKGNYRGKSVETKKPEFIKQLVDDWPDESTIIWCLYNREQETLEKVFPGAASIKGETPHDERMAMIGDFKSGRKKVLISKPKILGFGLNLQVTTRMVFSGLQDSYEGFIQAVKRANRVGSTKPLNVHIPVTDLEYPMVQNVLRKAHRVQKDTEEVEAMFKECGYFGLAT